MSAGNFNPTPMDIDDDSTLNQRPVQPANQTFVRQGPMTLTRSFANMALTGNQTSGSAPIPVQSPSNISLALPAPSTPRPAPTQPARDVSNQRNDNMYLYSQSGVCLGYYLGTEASTALENLMLSGQLESVLLSLFPASSTPASRSSGTPSSSASAASSSVASTSSSGYQSSVSDVDQQKKEFARMVSRGDWNIDEAQRLLTDIHLLHRSEQTSTRGQGNIRF